MHVLLVGPDFESNLSLGYLASSLRAAGHSATIVAFNDRGDVAEVMRRAARADVVGLSMSFQVRAPEFLALAADLKRERPSRPVIAGGHFATCAAEELMRDYPQLDLIVQHEGERAIVELCDLGDSMVSGAGALAGMVYRENGEVRVTPKRPILRDLDSLPLPDRGGAARLVAGVPTAYIMGSRGCIRSCDYCCITTLHRIAPGPRFRQREAAKVVEELSGLYHDRGVRQFVFHDDNFLVPSPKENQARLGAYHDAMTAARMEDIGIVMKCGPQDLDEAALQKLLSMGLLRIFLGIESGSQCGLDSIGRKQTTTDTERAVSLCEKYNVSSQYTMIIFNPEATIESMLLDLAFVQKHPAHPLNYCRAEIYAGTPLERRMLAEGNAIGTYMARGYNYRDPRVARVWEVGRDLFAGRCWGQDELLGHAIRLDHQATVLRHFYDGPEVEAVVRDFYAWQIRLNLDTARLFRELVVACGEAESSDCPVLRAKVDSIRARELPNRRAHLEEMCSLRARIEACTRPVIELATVRPMPAKLPVRAPRHTLALLVAAGLLGCGGAGSRNDDGVAEAAPPPLDTPYHAPPPPPDAGVRSDWGVAEAAPPPLDTPHPIPTYATPPDAGAPPPPPHPTTQPTTKATGKVRHDQGVAEAAPPPLKNNGL